VYDQTENPYLKSLVLYEFSKLNTINYFLTRGTNYNPNGRVQSMEDALKVDEKYKNLLLDNNIPYVEITIGPNNASIIANQIITLIS
jgi:hypothetical protein